MNTVIFKNEIPFNKEAKSQAIRDMKNEGIAFISSKKEKEILNGKS